MPGPFTERAQGVQDDIGWADSTNAMEMGRVTLHLAQLVTDLAREVDRINAQLAEASRILLEEAAKRPADPQPHDFESERGAPEGGMGACAVCGYARSAPVHD